MANLEYATTYEMVEELMERFDHAVFVGLRITEDDDGEGTGEMASFMRYAGSHHAVAGLMADAQVEVLIDLRKIRMDADDRC